MTASGESLSTTGAARRRGRVAWGWVCVVGRFVWRHPLLFLGCLVIVLAAVGAAAAGQIAPHDPFSENFLALDAWPGNGYPLGTDDLGRDVLARLLFGLRVSLMVGVLVETSNVLLGVILGTLSGFAGGWIDGLVQRLGDIFFAFPGILLAVLVNALFGSAFNTVLPAGAGRLALISFSFVLVGWPFMARFVRGQVLSLREREFVEAARALGASTPHILLRHILPNIANLILVWVTLDIAGVITGEATLSLLGLGIQPPYPSIGGMINEAVPQIDTNWGEVFWPSLALGLLVLAFTVIGDALQEMFDPRLRRG